MVALSALCGCKASRTAEAQLVYVKDTTTIKLLDSLLSYRLTKEQERTAAFRSEHSEVRSTDVLHVKDSVTARYDAVGNKIGEDRYHSEVRTISEKEVQKLRDSIDHYRELLDSISEYKASHDTATSDKNSVVYKTTYVEKELSKWQSFFLHTGELFYGLVIILGIYIVQYWLYRKIRS